MKRASIRSITVLLAIASVVLVVVAVAPPRASRAAAEEAPRSRSAATTRAPRRRPDRGRIGRSQLAHAGLRYRFATQATPISSPPIPRATRSRTRAPGGAVRAGRSLDLRRSRGSHLHLRHRGMPPELPRRAGALRRRRRAIAESGVGRASGGRSRSSSTTASSCSTSPAGRGVRRRRTLRRLHRRADLVAGDQSGLRRGAAALLGGERAAARHPGRARRRGRERDLERRRDELDQAHRGDAPSRCCRCATARWSWPTPACSTASRRPRITARSRRCASTHRERPCTTIAASSTTARW